MVVVFAGVVAVRPSSAQASLFSFMTGLFANQTQADTQITENSQNISLLQAATNSDPNPDKGEQDPTIVNDTSLLPNVGPTGTLATSSTQIFDSNQITTYVVRDGDTLPQIAQAFGISVDTIKIANDLDSSKITEGERLIILPVSGIQYTIKSGENLQSIAKKFSVTIDDIMNYNNLEGPTILAGETLFIPTTSIPVTSSGSTKTTTPTVSSGSKAVYSPGAIEPLLSAPLLGGAPGSGALISTKGFFIEPLAHYVKTQGLHGHNGVDLAAPTGTPIMAAADGEVIIARMGWNGGYGNYVVIQHSNNTQTLYAHTSKLLVSEGDEVTQGQTIALVGTTGESTGPHLHVEVRGGVNPF